MNLFEENYNQKKPLSYRYRPKNLSDFIGQEQLIGKNGIITKLIDKGRFINSIFWGSSGTGKTTLAEIISNELDYNYKYFNAIKSSINDIKILCEQAKLDFSINGRQTLLFLDEIHRFNKLQQDSLLYDIEEGNVILIGATTENPFYNLNNALLSRCLTFEFNKLSADNIYQILKNISDKENIQINDDILTYLSNITDGDARQAVNYLDLIISSEINFNLEEVKKIINSRKSYHKTEDKYDTISAMIKSIRGSDPDAAVYWLAKMLFGGEDPLYIARRLIISASEDIGLANPQALILASSCVDAVKEIGMPECRIILSQVAIYLACSPKSNSAYTAINEAISDIEVNGLQEVPHHLKKIGKKDYLYPHNYKNNFVNQQYMSKQKTFYKPSNNKFEISFKERLDKLWNK